MLMPSNTPLHLTASAPARARLLMYLASHVPQVSGNSLGRTACPAPYPTLVAPARARFTMTEVSYAAERDLRA
jgi:hypothetical protein